MNKVLFVKSVISCLNVPYMHTICVGVHHCSHDVIPCGCLQALPGLWSSLFYLYSRSISYGVIAVAIGNRIGNPMAADTSLPSGRFLSVHTRILKYQRIYMSIINLGMVFFVVINDFLSFVAHCGARIAGIVTD
jgi:hypothetical protein